MRGLGLRLSVQERPKVQVYRIDPKNKVYRSDPGCTGVTLLLLPWKERRLFHEAKRKRNGKRCLQRSLMNSLLVLNQRVLVDIQSRERKPVKRFDPVTGHGYVEKYDPIKGYGYKWYH